MTDNIANPVRTRRVGLILSGFTALAALFAVVDYTPLGFINVSPVQAVVLVVLGILGAAGSLLRLRVVLAIVGFALILAGLIRLFTYGHTIGIISGGVNTGALMVGLGVAFLAVWIVGRPTSV